MPGIHNTTFDIRILFITLLAGVLLVAPCKVRNSLEHSLGLEKSEVSNKIKTTLTSGSCTSFEAAQLESSTTKVLNMVTVGLPTVSRPISFKAPYKTAKVFSTEKQRLASVVPLYILYRHFKVYL